MKKQRKKKPLSSKNAALKRVLVMLSRREVEIMRHIKATTAEIKRLSENVVAEIEAVGAEAGVSNGISQIEYNAANLNKMQSQLTELRAGIRQMRRLMPQRLWLDIRDGKGWKP